MGFGTSTQASNGSSQGSSAALNQAYPTLSTAYTGTIGQSDKASNAIASLLGLNGQSAQSGGFDNFLGSSGYNFVKNQGMEGINSNDAAKGLLASGSALKSLDSYNTGLSQQYLNSYLSSLSGLAGTGISAGNTLSGAGNTSNSSNTSANTSTGSSMNVKLG